MEVIVLIDNNPHPTQDLLIEHGLSLYFEKDGYKWLFDVGASDGFHANATRLGIAMEEVDYLILSHAHFDHTGGLQHFLEINTKAKIYLSEHLVGMSYYSYSKGDKRSIGMNTSLIDRYPNRFHWVSENTKLSSHVNLLATVPNKYARPKGNDKLSTSDTNGERPDDFKHEISITVETKKGMVVLSACSHLGVLNTLDAAAKKHPNQLISHYFGGMHLINSNCNSVYESSSDIESLTNNLDKQYPHLHLISGHCTGSIAKEELKKHLKNRFDLFYSGARYQLPE